MSIYRSNSDIEMLPLRKFVVLVCFLDISVSEAKLLLNVRNGKAKCNYFKML